MPKRKKQFLAAIREDIFHKAYVGEAVNLIYILPLYFEKGALFDGHHPTARGTSSQGPGKIFIHERKTSPPWQLTFLATLCPRCGWNMEGEKDSVVLTCPNCQTAWEAERGRFVPVEFFSVLNDAPDLTYLPFWKMSVRTEGININTFADFIRITNQPKVVQESWHHKDMAFWAPAFKIRPKLFLFISRCLTLAHEDFEGQKMFPEPLRHPVTLPVAEAIQTIKVTLADATVNKKDIVPGLSGISPSVKGVTLAYLPFRKTGHDMIQLQTGLAINRKSLEFGRYL